MLGTLDRMHFLTACDTGLNFYTYHNNLLFIFDPRAFVSDMSQTALRKVLHWYENISAYNYTCVHIRS